MDWNTLNNNNSSNSYLNHSWRILSHNKNQRLLKDKQSNRMLSKERIKHLYDYHSFSQSSNNSINKGIIIIILNYQCFLRYLLNELALFKELKIILIPFLINNLPCWDSILKVISIILDMLNQLKKHLKYLTSLQVFQQLILMQGRHLYHLNKINHQD